MAYKCLHCGAEIKSIDKFVRCPYCGYRIVIKERPQIAKEVKTD